ncbi:MAG: response regulator [Desulfuromonadales bacterium]|nr:response regulator [Desulfuromonadales bacterium]
MMKILVVDDSLFSRLHTCKPLREAGYDLVEAADGIEGLAAVDEHRPDFIITDLLMPNLDGIDFLAALKERCNTTPTLVLTADIQDSKRQQCLELGARGFLYKPVMKEKLLEEIVKLSDL